MSLESDAVACARYLFDLLESGKHPLSAGFKDSVNLVQTRDSRSSGEQRLVDEHSAREAVRRRNLGESWSSIEDDTQFSRPALVRKARALGLNPTPNAKTK